MKYWYILAQSHVFITKWTYLDLTNSKVRASPAGVGSNTPSFWNHQFTFQKHDLLNKNWKFACGLRNASCIPAARAPAAAPPPPPPPPVESRFCWIRENIFPFLFQKSLCSWIRESKVLFFYSKYRFLTFWGKEKCCHLFIFYTCFIFVVNELERMTYK